MSKAFTLIETILYISIVTIVIIAVSRLGALIVSNSVKSQAQEEVFGTAQVISDRISYEIRNASGIASVTGSSISLTNFAPDTSTVISLAGDNVTLSKNGSAAVNLNPSGTKITELIFTDLSSITSTTRNIGFTLTVTQSYSGSNQIFNASTSLRSSAEVRSN